MDLQFRNDTDGERWFRTNEIWRDVIDRRTGEVVRQEFIRRNFGLVKYVPAQAQVDPTS